jgi:drug/metabolite transporter (DMT)-like permease
MPAPTNRPLAGITLRLVAVLALAVMFAAAKLAEARSANLGEIVFWRQAIAAPLVLGWVLANGGVGTLRTTRPVAHVRRMMIGLTGMIFNFWAVLLLPLAEATTFGFTVPIFATILSAIVLKEVTGAHRWGAVIVGFVGVLIVLQPGGHHVPLAGALVALTGAVMTATVTILIRDLGRTEPAPTIVFWFTVTSLVPLGIAFPFFAQGHDTATWALLIVMGIAGGIGQLALTGALKLAPVSVVVPMDYTSLIWATAFGWLLFDALPAPLTWLGAPIIVASGLYIVWREHRLRRAETPVAID